MPLFCGLHRCEAGFQAELAGKDLRLLRDVGRAVIGEHLDHRRGATGAEAAFHSFEHDVSDFRAADSGIHHRPPGDDLAIVGIDQEGAADDVAVPAGELEPVTAPAQDRAHEDDLAVVHLLGPPGVFPGRQQVVGLHDPIDPLVIDGHHPFGSQLSVQDRAIRRWP